MSAVGVPPRAVVERLQAAGVLVMNMVGHPRHAAKALDAGVDLLCAQGGEGGGHTGHVAASVLVPAVVDVASRYRGPPLVVAAGGVRDGRSLAAALMWGAAGVWVGTRFVASAEAACSDAHKADVLACGFDDTERTLVLSGRPLRMKTNDYVRDWHDRRAAELADLCARGLVPVEHDLDRGRDVDIPFLMGQVAAAIDTVQPAAEIVDDMVAGAVEMLRLGGLCLAGGRRQTPPSRAAAAAATAATIAVPVGVAGCESKPLSFSAVPCIPACQPYYGSNNSSNSVPVGVAGCESKPLSFPAVPCIPASQPYYSSSNNSNNVYMSWGTPSSLQRPAPTPTRHHNTPPASSVAR